MQIDRIEPPWPLDELARLDSLKSYGVLDTPAEEVFDRITRLTARHFDAPIALVSLVDETRQWFKARFGLDIACTGRKLAFCAYSILEERVMVVPDALADDRFADNALVTGPPHIRFYAGAPLVTPDRHLLGTLCVIDHKPRDDFGPDQRRDLAEFSRLVMHELEARRAMEEAERARRDAERADRAKTRFLAAASHDLRQPFQAMELLLGVLSQRLGGQPDPLELLERVQEALHSGQDLLNGLLDIATLEAGTVEPTVTAFPVRQVAERLTREMSAQADLKGLRLRVMDCNAVVRSDPLLLERILRNLLSNAIAHTGSGKILLGCRRRGPTLWLDVWDTGPGIPPEQQDLVFEEFYQLGNPERNRNKGLGLGLAIVRRTANLLGHRITVRSEVGKGTMFRVELPLADAPAPSSDPVAPPDAPALAGRTVLVIEDEEQQRGALSMFLQSQGCRTIVAASAEEAVARMGEGSGLPDAVVSDFRLTGRTTGLDAVAAVRQKAGRPVPAVLVTGDTDPARLRQAKRAGCALLHKPFRPDDLRRALSRAFERTPG
ncbi:ATP-binding protein [Azospirillum canadense]|uniref:ATP-binding protein n=1 Tax=Azospirillum canadense TaxID=403962 RepID=UPI002226043A|nr:ATP-binding protein [Azospirillum canadense]MCW2237725.1 signal transduction histidine kinase/CheY-like chemotaxis protein [Azospirillum canadense]